MSSISPNLFYNNSPRPAKIAKLEANRLPFEYEMPPWMRSVVHGPTLQWKVFKRQADALCFSKGHDQGLMTFVFQDSDGIRRFLCAHPVVFWFYDNNVKRPEDRHSYEVITEGAPCKLYFDLEFERAFNLKHDGVKMTDTFIKIVSWFLKNVFNVQSDRRFVLDLDSTTDVKFSRHLVFQLPKTYFRDNYNVGNFVKLICNKLRIIILSPGALNDLCLSSGVSEEDIKSLFVSDKHGVQRIFCDEAVYTKNRHFRIYKSSKWKKNSPLLVSPENEYEPVVSGTNPLPEKEIFLDSLISYVNLVHQDSIILEYGSVEQKSYIVKSLANLPESPLVSEQGTPSPQPVLDKFILKTVAPGSVRRSTYYSSRNTIIYEIVGYRFCQNIGRQHKSNNIYYVVDLNSFVYYQKCHDPDCSGYRSKEESLPPEIKFLLEREGDPGIEALSGLSDKELLDVWEAVSTVATQGGQESEDQDFSKFPEFGLSDSELLTAGHELEGSSH